MRHPRPPSTFLTGLALLAAAGCTDSGQPVDPPGPGPLYLATSWVADTDSTNTYVAVFDSIDGIAEVDFGTAIELPGYADSWVHNGKIYIAEGETPTVRRYTVGEQGGLVEELALSFANYGVANASFYDNDILSDTVAYLSNPVEREYIVWNPTTMEITGTTPWPALAFDPGLEPFHSYTDRGGSVVDGLYFHGIYGHNEDWDGFGGMSYILVHDVATNALVDTIAVPCPMMDVSSVGSDGYLYLSGWSYMPLSIVAGRSPTNCAARIDLATRKLDPAWTMTYPAVTGGDEASGLRVMNATSGVMAVFHGSGVEVTPDIDIWDLDAGDDDWEIFELDLATKQTTPTGVLFSDGSFYETHIGERYFVYLGKGPYTQVYERTAAGYEPRFRASGWLSRLFQIR